MDLASVASLGVRQKASASLTGSLKGLAAGMKKCSGSICVGPPLYGSGVSS